MSGQWEIVGKKKDKSGNKLPSVKTPGKDGNVSAKKKTNSTALNVKIEDVLPKSQVKNLYASGNKNKDANTKLPGDKKSLSDNEQKKAQQQNKDKNKKQPQGVSKPKPSKSIESALNLLNLYEFVTTYESHQLNFPDNGKLVLEMLGRYLNGRILLTTDDPIFSNKPFGYPSNLVPKEILQIFDEIYTQCGAIEMQVFFNAILYQMADLLNKYTSALGYKILLQYLALKEPRIVTALLHKIIDLRNSYENRPSVCLSILWVAGQVGVGDFQAGLEVYQQLFLPVIEMKHYSRFVVKYLIDLIKSAKNNVQHPLVLSKEQFNLILDTTFMERKNSPSDLKRELIALVPQLKVQQKNHEEFLKYFLQKLANSNEINQNKQYQDCVCDVVVRSMVVEDRGTGGLGVWSRIYQKNVTSSALVLNHIDKNWKSISRQLDNKVFAKTLLSFTEVNERLLMEKRKERGLSDAADSVKKLTDKMSSKTSKSGIVSIKSIFFLLSLVVAGVVYYDVLQQGSWKDSKTRKTLHETGICAYSHRALDKGKEGLLWVDGHIEEIFPGYQKTVVEFSEPYVILARDLGIVTYNMGVKVKDTVVENYPAVVQSIESYVPGLVENSQNALHNAWFTSQLYFNRSVDYMRKEVFVGKLSPENMQKVVIQALNTTQIKATEYYHWLYEKVQTSIK